MAKPPPDNLGKRQHELNNRVNEAFAKKTKFEDLKDEKETCEVDKFFKIDLAAKYRNVDYIIDVLKAGVTLYAHRALKKCQWLYDDEYLNIINPDYLHDNIFSVTSMRVTRLILKSVVIKVRREDRAIAFFKYCIKMNMTDLALNCILFTSDEFKLDLLLNKKPPLNKVIDRKHLYIRFLIGNSFDLLEGCLTMQTIGHESIMQRFRYMYPIDNNKYLDLYEKFVKHDKLYTSSAYTTKFDPKLCDDIMKKYKHRVLARPILYMNKIHEDILIRNITGEDAKIFLVTLLPESVYKFWGSSCLKYRTKLIERIPRNEIFEFLKQSFNEKYPGEEFEMSKFFYEQCYHDFLTEEKQEEWALNHIKSDKQILGVGNDYLWYEFVNFKVAFEEIKKYVIVTKDAEKRGNMLCTLIKAVRNDHDLEILFKYYDKRHVNEPQTQKRIFLDDVITYQRVFDFNDTSWDAFYSLLLSTELYNKDSDRKTEYPLEYYKTVTLIYHIVNEKELPDELINFLIEDFYPRTDTHNNTMTKLLRKLNNEKPRFLFNYLHQFYTNKIKEYKYQPYTQIGQNKTRRYFSVIVKLIHVFNVHQEAPKKVPKPQKQRKKRSGKTKLSDERLLRELKKDKNLVERSLPKFRECLKINCAIKINNFLKKIKIYFPNDITNTFLTMFQELISDKIILQLESKALEACVNGIFELGNEDLKLNFMKEYVPESAKIDFHNIDTQKLDIQRAVCRFASKSLPPLPINEMINYMQGDYIRFCLHIFSIYIAALPMTKSIELVEHVLDTPVSTQKHALRLAYQCFRPNSLKNISKEIWEKTKNVSLRSTIYKALYKRIVDKKESDLYDILISFTLDLHDDDENEIFTLVEGDALPNECLGKFKKATWQAISQFKDKEPNIGRKTQVINGIRYNFEVMDEEFIKTIIDEHFKTMFSGKKLYLTFSNEDIAKLYVGKWELVAYFIIAYSSDEDFDNREYIALAQNAIKECLKLWYETHSEKHIYQRWCWEFIEHLNTVSLLYSTCSECIIPIYEGLIDVIQDALPLYEIYTQKWEMELVIRERRALKNHRKDFGNEDKTEVVNDTSREFGREIGTLVSVYVNKEIYYRSFSEKMHTVIVKCVGNMLKIIFSSTNVNYNGYQNIALISLAAGLLEIESFETYMLALEVLPTNCEECSNENYHMIIDELEKFPHPEMQYALFQKLLEYQ